MSHAERCPVCCGEGFVRDTLGGGTALDKPCNGCRGCGWVTVQDLPEQSGQFDIGIKMDPTIPEGTIKICDSASGEQIGSIVNIGGNKIYAMQ